MPVNPTAQVMSYYKFTDEELSTFNAFKVSLIPSKEVLNYTLVEEGEGQQSAKRVKKDESDGSICTRLPSHLCLRIFDYLAPRDIVRCVSSSKGWKVDFLKELPNQYIVLTGKEAQKRFYQHLCAEKNRLFMIRSIHHFDFLKRGEVIKLLVSQPQFHEERVFVNHFQMKLRSTMKYCAYQKGLLNNKYSFSEIHICQDAGPRQQMIAIKVLEALFTRVEMIKKLTLKRLIMQMPYGFSFFEGKYFPVLEALDLSKSNIRIAHLLPLLRASPYLKELNLSECDRLVKGDFIGLQGLYLPELESLDLKGLSLGEVDLAVWLEIAPNLKEPSCS